jgi:hypothetical protein
MIYSISIAFVNGWGLRVSRPTAKEILEVLAQYDHEGSGISLKVNTNNGFEMEIQDNEAIYEFLWRMELKEN